MLKKVLYITNVPAPYRVDFFSELGKHCELTVVFERMSAKSRNLNWVSHSEATYKQIFLSGIKIGDDLSLSAGIIRVLKNKYDVVIIGMYSSPTEMIAIEYLRMKHIPFWISSDGGFIKADNKLKFYMKRILISPAAKYLSPSIFGDRYLANYGARENRVVRYHFTSIKRSQVLSTPINPEEKKQLRNKLNLEGEKIIIAVGSFFKQKGLDLLLEDAKNRKDPNVHYYCIGGSTRELTDLLGNALPANFHSIKFASADKLSQYYQAADIMVMPTRGDVWGLVVNEALANGVPVILSDKCGARAMIAGNNGNKIFKSDNINDLSQKITEMLMLSDSERNKVSRSAIKIAEHYTIENMVEDYISEINKLASN